MFEFASVGRIVFGRGAVARLGEIASPLGRRALIVANGSEALIVRVREMLAQAGVHASAVRQKGEPTVEDIDRAVDVARREACDMVVGLGGGSAIDAAKAVAGMLTNGGSLLDYLEVVGKGQKISKLAAPWIAIPCTAGTGAEVTKNAVIGYPPKRMKASIRSELLLARVAVVDPELGVGVPPEVTARTGMDALCQLIEGYTSSGANAMTDALAVEGIRRAGRSLKRAYVQGDDVEAREDMAMAALLSGMVLANAGLGAAHGLAAPLGASFPVPHGTACAVLLPPVMATNAAALRKADGRHPVLDRYAAVGEMLTGRRSVEEGIAFVRGLVGEMGIPGLRRFGIAEQGFGGVVALAQKSSSMRFNPVRLTDDALHEVLGAAM